MKLSKLTGSVCGILLEGPDLLNVLLKQFPGLKDTISQYADINNLKMIGMGDKGTVFSDGNVVIKITEDASEAIASGNLVGIDIPGANKILLVKQFARPIPYKDIYDEEPIDTKYYLIIQNKLDINLNPREKEITNLLGDFLSNNRLNYPLDIKRLKEVIFNYGYVKYHKMFKSPRADVILDRLLGTMQNLFVKRKVKLGDVSTQNIGKDADGNLTIFDFGLSDSPKINLPAV
jgi:hypothetical protein